MFLFKVIQSPEVETDKK